MNIAKRIRGRRWMEIREQWFRLHPLCVECEKVGRVTQATQLDHIIALMNGGLDNESNYQSLCKPHHDDKTAQDKGTNRMPEIGLDGWPIG